MQYVNRELFEQLKKDFPEFDSVDLLMLYVSIDYYQKIFNHMPERVRPYLKI